MDAFKEAMLQKGFDKVANTIYKTSNKGTVCTKDEFILWTTHATAMLTSTCAQTSDAIGCRPRLRSW